MWFFFLLITLMLLTSVAILVFVAQLIRFARPGASESRRAQLKKQLLISGIAAGVLFVGMVVMIVLLVMMFGEQAELLPVGTETALRTLLSGSGLL